MSEIPGTLNIMNDISRLDGDLLLKAGITDETQAKFAATTFLEVDCDLHSGNSIVVTGETVAPGKIRMSNARAASTEALIAADVSEHRKKAAFAPTTEGTTKRKRRVRRKSKKSDKKIEVEC